jgi:hypothetical protein
MARCRHCASASQRLHCASRAWARHVHVLPVCARSGAASARAWARPAWAQSDMTLGTVLARPNSSATWRRSCRSPSSSPKPGRSQARHWAWCWRGQFLQQLGGQAVAVRRRVQSLGVVRRSTGHGVGAANFFSNLEEKLS